MKAHTTPPGCAGDRRRLLILAVGRLHELTGILLLAAVLGLTIAASAEAHTLDLQRAAKANKAFAKVLCEAVNDSGATCLSSKPGSCQRVTEHRVRCSLFVTLQPEDGSQARCRSLIEWSIQAGSGHLHRRSLGVRSCKELRGPRVEGEHTRTYVVPSESMEPAFSPGQMVIVDLDAYSEAQPEIGDAVVFHPPRGAIRGSECGKRHRRREACPLPTPKLSSQLFLKRVVALPEDRLSIRRGRPVVDGTPVLKDLIQPCRYGACNLRRTITIPPNHYFVMGDNSGASDDSRFWGPVPSRAIIGKVIF